MRPRQYAPGRPPLSATKPARPRNTQDLTNIEAASNSASPSATSPPGVSIARISQIEHGEVTSFEVIARYIEALGGRLDLVADFGDRTVHFPVIHTAETTAS